MNTAKPKFRLFRFNLKTLLIFMLASGVFLGVVIPRQMRANRETEAIKAIEGMVSTGRKQQDNFEFCYDFQMPERRPSALSEKMAFVDEESSKTTPQWIRSTLGENTFSWIEGVRLDTVGIRGLSRSADGIIDQLPSFKSLNRLHLRIGSGAPRDLKKISRIKSLNDLTLESFLNLGTLEGVQNLRRLETLKLRNVGIKSAQPLSRMARLRHLEITWCFKLESLDFLATHSRLESLNVGAFPQITTFDFAQLLNNKRLKELRLQAFNGFSNTHLLDSFPELEQLELIACDGFKSAALIEKATPLKKLKLAGCSIESLDKIGALSQLEEIEIDACNSLRDYQSLDQLKKLKALTLGNMEIGKFPRIDSLPTLEVLEIKDMPELESIDGIGDIEAPNLISVTIQDCGLLKYEQIQRLEDSLPNVRITVR